MANDLQLTVQQFFAQINVVQANLDNATATMSQLNTTLNSALPALPVLLVRACVVVVGGLVVCLANPTREREGGDTSRWTTTAARCRRRSTSP